MKSARRKHFTEVLSTSCQGSQSKQREPNLLEIKFMSFDMSEAIAIHDDPIVISIVMVNAEVKMVFVDQGSSADIIFKRHLASWAYETLIYKPTRSS